MGKKRNMLLFQHRRPLLTDVSDQSFISNSSTKRDCTYSSLFRPLNQRQGMGGGAQAGADVPKQKATKAFVWVRKKTRLRGAWSRASDQWECDVPALCAGSSGFLQPSQQFARLINGVRAVSLFFGAPTERGV